MSDGVAYNVKLREMAKKQIAENIFKLQHNNLKSDERIRLAGLNHILVDVLKGERICVYMMKKKREELIVFMEWYNPEGEQARHITKFEIRSDINGLFALDDLHVALKNHVKNGYKITNEITPVLTEARKYFENDGYVAEHYNPFKPEED